MWGWWWGIVRQSEAGASAATATGDACAGGEGGSEQLTTGQHGHSCGGEVAGRVANRGGIASFFWTHSGSSVGFRRGVPGSFGPQGPPDLPSAAGIEELMPRFGVEDVPQHVLPTLRPEVRPGEFRRLGCEHT